MADWHGIIERAVDRNPISCTLVRIGSPDIEVTLVMGARQYQEVDVAMGGSAAGQTQRWMVPARRLAATVFPGAPRIGDLLRVGGAEARVTAAAAGYAGGEVVRWDLDTEGVYQ